MKRFLLVYEGKEMFLLLKVIRCRTESEVSWLKRYSWEQKRQCDEKQRKANSRVEEKPAHIENGLNQLIII